jgi:hypothetical protein
MHRLQALQLALERLKPLGEELGPPLLEAAFGLPILAGVVAQLGGQERGEGAAMEQAAPSRALTEENRILLQQGADQALIKEGEGLGDARGR